MALCCVIGWVKCGFVLCYRVGEVLCCVIGWVKCCAVL